ncbi:MAG: YifB family Mg chelatase-like AAA ATPase [Pseudomonadota bacterium]
MIARIYTVAFEGLEARLVEVQCAVSPGLPAFGLVGLPDKAVSEAKERVRAAIGALGLALPAKRITVNLSPADMPKEGSHFDLPIAMALLAAMDVLPLEDCAGLVAMGELSLDGTLVKVAGALPAALAAAEASCGLVCPAPSGAEAAWVGAAQVIAPLRLLDLVNHLKGQAVLAPAEPGETAPEASDMCLSEVRGQEKAKRALEIAAAGRHHLLFVGPPGNGKSMLARCLPSILPPLSAEEALETCMVRSIKGVLEDGGILRTRPFERPHHSASRAAIIGGGRGAGPGAISLAHNGVLFLDEMPEFERGVLESLREPLETGDVIVARAQAQVRYPSRFLLVAAANPCRCGHLGNSAEACARAPLCGAEYLGKISGPLMDRMDLRVEVPPVSIDDVRRAPRGEGSAEVARRVRTARARQAARFAGEPSLRLNADLTGERLMAAAVMSDEASDLVDRVARQAKLTARGFHRVLRVARTIADLAEAEEIGRGHMAEALNYRLAMKAH